jgi:hypothetical protein
MTTLHISAFEHLYPTALQKTRMNDVRQRFFVLAQALEAQLPEGADKTYTMRKLREVAMWANVTITRYPDGSPRPDDTPRDVA